MTTLLAVDLGAQSGRVVRGTLDGERLTIDEVDRFSNGPVRRDGRLAWDGAALRRGLVGGLARAAEHTDGDIDAIGVDAWGLDFGLVDRDGTLLADPGHHRDPRNRAAMEEVHELIGARAVYDATGVQMMEGNSLYQLWAMAQAGALDGAHRLLMIPDLCHHWLTGTCGSERTAASTTQCYDPRSGDWARPLLDALGLPTELLGPIVEPGDDLGPLRHEVSSSSALRKTRVIAPAAHDTASAVVAIPFQRSDAAFISSGTWSLVGIEIAEPIIDAASFAANLTNEAGYGGTTRLLRNVTGLWLLEQSRQAWSAAGADHSPHALVAAALHAEPLRSLVDPNDPAFTAPGDMPSRIAQACVRSGQPAPDGVGPTVRCILESLALKYRETIGLLAAVSGIAPAVVHVVGGGAQIAPLCQWTADAIGVPVVAGPVEASAIGNLLVQAIALGELDSLQDARALVARSQATTTYAPSPAGAGAWDEAYGRFRSLAGAATAVRT